MSYQVLARKWRPKTFDELAGQEHVLKALINALENQRLHHAYLFTGTRGVGKTTIARILARALNCETGVTARPCGKCSACLEINEGRFVDLIEVDAASRTKVEDTRELLENIQYRPTRGRYKIYLIDEVHMLSTHSFNALLKTLEEPPEHVKFLLATTDPQKLPVTVLSRCLQFNLKNLTSARIEEHLEFVLGEEKVPFDTEALWHLARAANGSMRDALSLTDQAISHGGGKLGEADVVNMLGTVDRKKIYELVDALVKNDLKTMLAVSDSLSEFSPDYFALVQDLLVLMHAVAVQQRVPAASKAEGLDLEKIEAYANQFSPEEVQLIYQMLLMGQKDIAIAPDLHMGFEMLLLRLAAFQPAKANEEFPGLAAEAAAEQNFEATGEVIGAKKSEAASRKAAEEDAGQNEAKLADQGTNSVSEPGIMEPSEAGLSEQKLSEENRPEAHFETDALKTPANAPDSDLPPWEEAVHALASEQTVDEEHSAEVLTEPQPEVPANSVSVENGKRAGYSMDLSDDGLDPPASLNELSPENWIATFNRLSINGMVKSLCAHLVLESVVEQKLSMVLTEPAQKVFDSSHQQKLTKAIESFFGMPVEIDVEQGISSRETPAQFADRLYTERLAEAERSIMASPVVQALVEEFQAELVPGSVRLNNQDFVN